MNYHIVSLTPVSITVERDDLTPYYSEKSHDVFLNGEKALGAKTNVFTLFSLKPDTSYVLSIDGKETEFKTGKVTSVLHASAFKRENPEMDDTLLLQSAISFTPKGGRLVIDGEYSVTSLFLRSDRILYLPKGSILKGNPKAKDYPLLPPFRLVEGRKVPCQSWEGDYYPSKPSLLNIIEEENVRILGEGRIDGLANESNEFWNDVKNLPYGRPSLFYSYKAKNVSLIGLSFRNTPAWTIHPFFSENLHFLSLSIFNPKDAPNTDGRDLECCTKRQVLGVRFSVGDDCIALKSGKIGLAKERKRALSDCVIRNCLRENGHGAIVLGSEAGYGIKDIQVERCLFKNTDRGLRIKTRRGRGKDSIRDGILFKEITRDGVLTPLVRNRFYFCDPDGKSEYVQNKNPLPVDKRTPYLGSFVFQDIVARNCEVCFGYFYGLPEKRIKSIVIKDSLFERKKEAREGRPARRLGVEKRKKKGFLFTNVEKVVLDHVKMAGREGERVEKENVLSLKDDG